MIDLLVVLKTLPMMDFSQRLVERIDTIVETWVATVQQDEQLESAKELTYREIRNSLPRVLHAIATMLSQTQENDIDSLVQASLEHGILRANQGYDAAEIAREYRLVRWVIFSILEPDLLQGSTAEAMRAVRLIDTAIDEVIARCFQSYTNERLLELQQLQSQLRLTNQELTRLVRASKDNMAQLAHELKTPLTSIIGYSDLFLRQQRQPTDRQDRDNTQNLGHIEKILNSGRQLLHLINDALEISRYEAGQMRLQPVPTDVRSLIDGLVEMVEPLVEAKHLELIVNYERAPAQVVTDSLRLQQVISNLLSNAIRYTESGSITLSCHQVSEQAWALQVSDTGIGITPEDQQQIYDPYFRVVVGDQAYLPNSTGLGLAIVSRLVKLLQGKIELQSAAGIGSTFKLILPLTVELAAPTVIK